MGTGALCMPGQHQVGGALYYMLKCLSLFLITCRQAICNILGNVGSFVGPHFQPSQNRCHFNIKAITELNEILLRPYFIESIHSAKLFFLCQLMLFSPKAAEC